MDGENRQIWERGVEGANRQAIVRANDGIVRCQERNQR
jgi:hypothetical protein